jgi:hypothetical protein
MMKSRFAPTLQLGGAPGVTLVLPRVGAQSAAAHRFEIRKGEGTRGRYSSLARSAAGIME